MSGFSTSLVREKIVFVLKEHKEQGRDPLIIRSNRIHLPLTRKTVTENIVIRAQNMPDTLRMAGLVMDEYYRHGPFEGQDIAWDEIWDEAVSAYGRRFNKDKNWVAVYLNGHSVFETTRSPFVDVVEQCALLTLDNYDKSMEVAETALGKIGKSTRIEHAANIATVLTDNGENTRVGVMYRGVGNGRTFNFTAGGGGTRTGRILRSLIGAAAFLENIDLKLFITDTEKRLARDGVDAQSDDAVKCHAASTRRGELARYITQFEKQYTVNYRPEKPDFFTDL